MKDRINRPDTDTDIIIRQCLDGLSSFVMIAGAGSGKTTSLVKALDYLRRTQGSLLRQRGQKIACITYTEIATEQINGDVGHDPLFHVSTIHSFLWSLISPFQTDLKAWVCNRIDEKLAKLQEEKRGFGPRVQQRTRDKNDREFSKFTSLRARIETFPRFTYGTGSNYAQGILGHDDIINMGPAMIQGVPLLRTLLAQKYPYFFVDESQDTVPPVVEALKAVWSQSQKTFCLGFFGDPMQQIYTTGIGQIPIETGWAKIQKPENFRSSAKVLAVINNIRRAGDSLQQTAAITDIHRVRNPVGTGAVNLFILPADNQRQERLIQVRRLVAQVNQDPLWTSDEKEADFKMLVIVHRMAAIRLGFDKLYAALNDGAPDSFKTGLVEGTLWVVKPFLEVLLPLVEAINVDEFKVIGLLRTHSPRLRAEHWKESRKPQELLSSLQGDVTLLGTLLAPGGIATVWDVLRFVNNVKLIDLDDRFGEFLDQDSRTPKQDKIGMPPPEEAEDEAEKRRGAMGAFLACPARELWGYRRYIEHRSPYSTQHGIKGDEFQRVLVVLDDGESTYMQYSYEKLLGLQPLSATDVKNRQEGKDSVLERTRRLFYVCCSRAKKDLVVVLFTADCEKAKRVIKASGIFEGDCIKTALELPLS